MVHVTEWVCVPVGSAELCPIESVVLDYTVSFYQTQVFITPGHSFSHKGNRLNFCCMWATPLLSLILSRGLVCRTQRVLSQWRSRLNEQCCSVELWKERHPLTARSIESSKKVY